IVIPMSPEMSITQWHVPVNDETCYWYAVFTSFTDAVDKPLMREQRLELYELPDYKPRLNKANTYGFNPAEQEADTYLGMGLDINVHDQWAVESPGPIFDRTNEHLGKSDVGIIAYRRMLRRAIEAAGNGGELPMDLRGVDGAAIRGPAAVDTIADLEGWQDIWKKRDRERREASGWAPDPW
ncbi:MAG: aromatic ring-hydroxylating dioxygenase subunit alpha, partial [Rhizobiales bacterium]|nr:aromatic ring-hydroxylating dioxygenase subunit alpha [Hyphomicrobiales bacterium]